MNNNIEWVKKEELSPDEYITLYLNNKQIYLNKEIQNQINFNFNYVKLGISKDDKKIFIKPIPPEKKDDFSLHHLNKFKSKTSKFSNVNFVEGILNLIENKDFLKNINSLRISTEVKELEDLGLVIIGDLTNIYPN